MCDLKETYAFTGLFFPLVCLYLFFVYVKDLQLDSLKHLIWAFRDVTSWHLRSLSCPLINPGKVADLQSGGGQ